MGYQNHTFSGSRWSDMVQCIRPLLMGLQDTLQMEFPVPVGEEKLSALELTRTADGVQITARMDMSDFGWSAPLELTCDAAPEEAVTAIVGQLTGLAPGEAGQTYIDNLFYQPSEREAGQADWHDPYVGLVYAVYVEQLPEGDCLSLGSGSSSVEKFYDLARAGIAGAVAEFLPCCMCVNVRLSGRDLKNFLQKHYPEEYREIREQIRNNTVYEIVCVDNS